MAGDRRVQRELTPFVTREGERERADMDKEELQALWEQTTDLPDSKESPLAIAIIAEALGEGDDDAQAVANRLYRIAQDCEDFANAITERAQGLTR